MSAHTLLPTLTGTIEYRLKLGNGTKKKKKKKKKEKGINSSAATERIIGKKRPRPADDNANSSSASDGSGWVKNAGYFFIPRDEHVHDVLGSQIDAHATTSSNTSRSRAYHIVYPFASIDTICRAAVTKAKVQITRYHWVNFGSPDGMDEDDSRGGDDDNGGGKSHSSSAKQFSARVLEIHTGGVSIVKEKSNSKQSMDDDGDDEKPMTLTQFADLENERRSTGKSTQSHSSSERYTIVAKIDATSAVIAAIPSDPFALVELYEEPSCEDVSCVEEAPLSAVAVLRGWSALAVHEALQPGSMVTLKSVRRQRWHVPRSFEDEKLGVASARLKDRAPSHVFVIDDGRSISWPSDCGKEPTNDGSVDSFGKFPPLPTTPIPLQAVQGSVVSVRRADMGASGETIHSVLIECGEDTTDSTPSPKCKLYLTYYPVTPGLIWGLRRGAFIRAVNVYRVDAGLWAATKNDVRRVLGASVRSSVVVLNSPTDKEQPKASSNAFLTQAPEATWLPATRCRPYSFISLKRTCHELEWREKLRAAWFDKSGLGTLSDTPPFEEISRNLLAQYAEVARSNRAEVTCAETKLNGKGAVDRSARKKTKRDPYVEFFCQACDNGTEEEQPALSSLPTVAPLKRIRDVCIGHIKTSIVRAFSHEHACSATIQGPANRKERMPVKSGWTASRSFDMCFLRQALVDERSNNHMPISLYACGIAGEQLMSIRDGFCQLPLCLAFSEDNPSHLNARLQASCGMNIESGTFLALPIHSVVVSCICLGGKPKNSSQSEVIKYLPSLSALDDTNMTGGCAVFVVNGLLFIASAYIRCIQPQIVRVIDAGKKILMSVQDSLDGDDTRIGSDISDSNTFIVGRLVRQRYSLRKLQHGQYKGCVLTLSHVSLKGPDQERKGADDTSNISDLQCIELKLSAKGISSAEMSQMRLALRFLFEAAEEVEPGKHRPAIISPVVCDDQIGLATAWWIMAEDARFAPLLCGGRDESQTRQGLLSSIHVRFPFAARETSGHGYRRFKCNIEDIVAYTSIQSADESNDTSSSLLQSDCYFDCVGGEKFLPGMLDRLPERTHYMGDRRHCLPEYISGVPTHTLAQLHWDICQDLKHKARTSSAPSLARRITGARLLGVTFCRARAECTRCFQFLTRGGNSNETPKTAKSGVVTSVRLSIASSPKGDGEEENTFWHLPLDFECDGASPKQKRGQSTPAVNRSDRTGNKKSAIRTNLRCPNECPADFASIKWECSGVVDDGTGQAKLHAEREAALALIGSGFDVSSVEDGAWAVDSGITFQKSVPPRSFIRNAVREAQMMAHQLARDNPTPKKKKVRASDIMKLLTPEAKAEYTLQRYCRFSKEPLRFMDIICRCKPISDGAEDLNRTDIEVTTARCEDKQEAVASDAITYTLPPLKLNLIDLCSVVDTHCDEGWSLVRAMMDNK